MSEEAAMTRRDAPHAARSGGAALALLAALASTPAAAQMFPSIGHRPLTPDDMERMKAAAARLYEGQSIGRVERWRSPTSKNAGQLTLTRIFTARGMPCRTIVYTIRFHYDRDALRQYKYNWCMVSSNTWKIVELGDTE
jgi:hypothetical protein